MGRNVHACQGGASSSALRLPNECRQGGDVLGPGMSSREQPGLVVAATIKVNRPGDSELVSKVSEISASLANRGTLVLAKRSE